MAEVKLERDTLGWDPAQIKDEPDIKQEPEEFPFHMVTVKAEDDDDKPPVLHLRSTEGEECGSGADSQEHSDSSDTDCSEDYSHQQAPAKRSYAMIPPDSIVPDSRPFICTDCGKGFKDKFVLQRHVLYVHRGERPHECSVCGKSFKTKTVLNNHMKIHTGERSHICSVCEKGFIKKFDLSRHQMFVHHLCPVCPKRCSEEVGLNKHLKTHVDEGTLDKFSFLFRETVIPFSCPQCDISFRFNSQLQVHLLHHKKERPHKCSGCEKMFTQKSTLKDHMKIHMGDKSFVCSFCKKCFVKKSDLTRHQTFVHYICPICSNRVTDRVSLHQHLKSHVDEGILDQSSPLIRDTGKAFSCQECGKRYAWNSSLRAHMLCHTAGRPETSPVCEEEVDPKVIPKVDQKVDPTVIPKAGHKVDPKVIPKVDQKVDPTVIPKVDPTVIPKADPTVIPKVDPTVIPKADPTVIPKVDHKVDPTVINKVDPKVDPDRQSPSTVPPPDKPFSCAECGKCFRWLSLLKIHMWVHTKDSPHKCSVCEKSCRNKYELKQHLRNQHDIVVPKDKTDPEMNHIPFSCLECGKTMCKEQDIMRHMRKHIGEKALLCSVCNKDFGNAPALLRHRKQVHHICPVCSMQLQNKTKLNAHLRAHIKDGTLDPESNLLRDTIEPFRCADCGKTFTCGANLRRHMKVHTGEGPLQCSECGKRFRKEKTLQRHLRFHTSPKPFRCAVCDECFTSCTSLRRHMRTHAEHKRFACSVCDKAFRSKAALTVHMKTHCEERPFVCPVCERSFVQQRDLTQHQRLVHHICPICSLGFTNKFELKTHLSSHSETQLQEFLNPFGCSECGKRFALDQYLQTHMTSHSEERPFKCSVCEKRFKKDSHLTMHMKTHKGDCSECGMKVKSGLSSHLRIVHQISVCSVCKERFTDKVDLKEHIMNHVKNGTLCRFSARIYTCSECGELFFRKNSLERHEREAHKRS